VELEYLDTVASPEQIPIDRTDIKIRCSGIRWHRLLDFLCVGFLRHFVSEEGASGILRHFAIEAQLINFVIRNCGANDIRRAELLPKGLGGLGDGAVMKHDARIDRGFRVPFPDPSEHRLGEDQASHLREEDHEDLARRRSVPGLVPGAGENRQKPAEFSSDETVDAALEIDLLADRRPSRSRR
jgi:hypothetical protein